MSEVKYIWDMPSVEIPAEFYSEITHAPFEKCSLCDKVFGKEEIYVVEKSFKRSKAQAEPELIFEYALCGDCQENLRAELSEKSLKNIAMYYQLYVDFGKRAKELLANKEKDLSKWISNCIITGKPIANEKEFTIGGMCYNGRMFFDTMPFALGEKAVYEMQEVLSKKTKDILDGFQKDIFPPEIREKLPDGRLILL